ncbi:MAG: AraC family transcriptional regulator [Spirochaetes bacterium]|nr:AraC family transcriptional regulator [Spirochaetota bacterium]
MSNGVALGFNSYTTFCTVFSKMVGMSPKQYRKEHLKNDQLQNH